VDADASMRRGVVSMTHAFGGLPGDDDPLVHGVNTGRLISLDNELQPISAMPRMSAVPVTIEPAYSPSAARVTSSQDAQVASLLG